MLVVSNVYLKYTKEYNTLNNINLTIDDNEHILLFGEKESGKSSLIRVIAGLEKVTSGDVLIKNIEIDKLDLKNDISLGYLSALGSFFERQTVQKNLEYVLKIRKLDKDSILSKVNGVILSYGLEGIKDRKLKDLSDYDRIRVAIARLSLRKLEFLIVDDIFENFADSDAIKLCRLINALIEQNDCTSIVAVSSEDILKQFKGRVVKLKFGSIID
ncbi:MAG: ATP-binding cassette domain-containing protein [Clostridia bacterium]|nr:ATP-binding cassette domain-containing protein [Clostridia bacterium]